VTDLRGGVPLKGRRGVPRSFSLSSKGLKLPGGAEWGGGTIDIRNANNAGKTRGVRGLDTGKPPPNGGQTVGVAPHSVDIQTVMPRMHSENRGGIVIDVLSGTEFLESITTGSTGSLAGDILEALLINPSSFNATRLKQFSPLYQRYRFRKFNILYAPIANATESGQLIGFSDYDVDSLLEGDSETNISVAAAHLGQQICQIWEDQVFPFGIVDAYTTLFTSLEGAENRLIYQGIFYILAASELGGSLNLGNLYVDYEVEFYIPQLSEVTALKAYYQIYLTGNTAGVTPALPFGTACDEVAPPTGLPPNSGLTLDSFIAGTGQITIGQTLPPGPYVIMGKTCQWTATTASGVTWSPGASIIGGSLENWGLDSHTVIAAGNHVLSGSCVVYAVLGTQLQFTPAVTVTGSLVYQSGICQWLMISVGELSPSAGRRVSKILARIARTLDDSQRRAINRKIVLARENERVAKSEIIDQSASPKCLKSIGEESEDQSIGGTDTEQQCPGQTIFNPSELGQKEEYLKGCNSACPVHGRLCSEKS